MLAGAASRAPTPSGRPQRNGGPRVRRQRLSLTDAATWRHSWFCVCVCCVFVDAKPRQHCLKAPRPKLRDTVRNRRQQCTTAWLVEAKPLQSLTPATPHFPCCGLERQWRLCHRATSTTGRTLLARGIVFTLEVLSVRASSYIHSLALSPRHRPTDASTSPTPIPTNMGKFAAVVSRLRRTFSRSSSRRSRRVATAPTDASRADSGLGDDGECLRSTSPAALLRLPVTAKAMHIEHRPDTPHSRTRRLVIMPMYESMLTHAALSHHHRHPAVHCWRWQPYVRHGSGGGRRHGDDRPKHHCLARRPGAP